jgi:hypothetical protein
LVGSAYYLLIIWEDAVLPETASSHNICYTQNHRIFFNGWKEKKDWIREHGSKL